MKIDHWIRESNLIEDVDDAAEDARSQRAWIWLQRQPFMEKTILNLHKRIMGKKLPAHQAGHWRTCQVWVGGREGIPYQDIVSSIFIWISTFRWSLTAEAIQWSHVEFEKIHPFIDGNGRTGRMIMNWQRVISGLEPLCIEAAERWKYYEWFNEPNPPGGSKCLKQ